MFLHTTQYNSIHVIKDRIVRLFFFPSSKIQLSRGILRQKKLTGFGLQQQVYVLTRLYIYIYIYIVFIFSILDMLQEFS